MTNPPTRLEGPLWWGAFGIFYLGCASLAALYSGACFIGRGCGYGAVPALGLVAVLLPLAAVSGILLLREAIRRIRAGAR